MGYKRLACMKTFSLKPLSVYFIFSFFFTTSLSHWDIEGVLAEFKCNSMIRLAVRNVNAIICFCLQLGANVPSVVPKIAQRTWQQIEVKY